jgi:hypothetical protein
MQPLIDSSPARRHTWSAAPLMLLLGFGGLNAKAADLYIQTRGSRKSSRLLATLRRKHGPISSQDPEQ